MVFDKRMVYSPLNADELHKGDKVIVADTLLDLRDKVVRNAPTYIIDSIADDTIELRFNVQINPGERIIGYTWAYLIDAAGPLTWTKLKLGDRIRKNGRHAMVTCIDEHDRSGMHIAAGGNWVFDEELADWEKDDDN